MMKKFVANVMIWLLLTIPFVAAQDLSINQFSGQDNATGYARPRDSLKIEALAQIPGEDIIDAQQLRVYIGESFSFFDRCVKEPNSQFYRCVFEEPEFEAYRPIPFSIELRNDDSRRVANRSALLGIDNIAPVIKEFKAEPVVTTGNIVFTYSVEDYGLVHGTPTECSGIKEVLFIENGQTLVAELGTSGGCTKSRSVNYILNESGTVCMKVRDFLGQESQEQCKNVVVDKGAPQVRNLVMTDAQGNTLSHVHRGEEKLATITVQITDESQVNRNEVFADFGQISARSGFITPTAVSGNLYIWRNVPVHESSSCKITVKATDILSNNQVVDFPCTMTADNTPPTVKGIVPQGTRDGKPLYGKGTYLIVEFEDKDNAGGPGAGFERGNAFADLQSLGLGKFVKAQSCVFESTWKCSWLLNAQGIDEKEYEISVSGTDDLDNALVSPQKFTIVYDDTSPVTPVIAERKVLKGEDTGSASAPVEGNYLQFIIRSQGFNEARANWSELGGDENEIAKSCVPIENSPQIECIFEHRIDYAGPYTALIGFTFVDDAGNKAQTSATVDVFGLENQTSATYWKAAVSCTPELIDRATASIISPYVSCKVALKSQRKDISPLIIQGPQSPEECSGSGAASVEDVYVTNNAAGSKEPFLVLKLSARNYEVDDLNVSCPLSILSKSERRVNQTTQGFVAPLPQNLPVKVSMKFYNVPQKDLYAQVDEQIEDALNDGFANQAWLGSLRKFLHYAEILCQIKSMITNVIGTFYTLAIVFGALADASFAVPPAKTSLEAAKSVMCHTEEATEASYTTIQSILSVLDQVCSMVNCNVAQGGKSEWSVPNIVGGGSPFCNSVTGFVNELPVLNNVNTANQESVIRRTGGEFNNTAVVPALNIKDSLIWSTVCLCLPGIIYNLEKLRQVQCFKAVCLNDDVKEKGYPVSYCNEMHQYFICQYVIGQIFATLPFSQFFERLINMIIDIITDPLALFTVILGGVCEWTCFVPSIGAFAACATIKTAAVMSEAVASVTHMSTTKGYFQTPPEGQYCKRVEEIKKERKEKESGGE